MAEALPARRWLAVFLVFSLLALSPGPGAFAAAVAVVAQPVAAPVILGAGALGAAPLAAAQGSSLGSPQRLAGASAGSALLLPALPQAWSPAGIGGIVSASPDAPRLAAVPGAARALAPLAAPTRLNARASPAAARADSGARGSASVDMLPEPPALLPEERRAAVSARTAELLQAFDAKPADEVSPPPGQMLSKTQGAELSGRSLPRPDPARDAPVDAPKPPANPAKHRHGLGRAAQLFIAAGAIVWIGVSAMDLVGPTLAEKLFSDFSVMGVVFAAGSILGQALAPWVITHLGIKRAYIGSLGIGIGSGLLLAGAYLTGTLGYPLMLLSYFGYSVAHGFWWNSTDSLAPSLVGRNRARLERFWGWDLLACGLLGVTVNIATGALVASHGFLPILILFPVSFGLALTVALKGFRRIADQLRAQKELAAAAHKRGFWSGLLHGAKLVFRNPALRPTYWAYVLFMMLTPIVYQTLAPGYGLAVMDGNPELATGVSSLITGLFGLGGLLAGAWMMVWGKRLSRKKASVALASPERAHRFEMSSLHKSLSRWMSWGTVGLAAIGLMAIPLPHLGALVSLPGWLSWLRYLTMPALAIAPFAVCQNVLVLKLRSRYQELIRSDDDMPSAMSFLGISAMAASGLALLGAKLLFSAASGFTPFLFIALALIPLMAALRKLRARLSEPERAVPPPVRPHLPVPLARTRVRSRRAMEIPSGAALLVS